MILIVELAVLALVQTAWCCYYATRYAWRTTPLGPVWLAKGGLLAALWPLLAVNELVGMPHWVWVALIGPALIAATAAWLVVTVRVRRAAHPRRIDPPSDS